MKVQKQRLEIVAERDGSYNWDGQRELTCPEDAWVSLKKRGGW